MRTTTGDGGEGAALAFQDCRDPDCDACRATRYYGVAWSVDNCINHGRSFDLEAKGSSILDALKKWRPTDDESIEGQLLPLETPEARCSCGWSGPAAAADDHDCALEDLDECIDCGGSTAAGSPDPHICTGES